MEVAYFTLDLISFDIKISSSFVSGVAGPLLGMFMLGSLFPFANKWVCII